MFRKPSAMEASLAAAGALALGCWAVWLAVLESNSSGFSGSTWNRVIGKGTYHYLVPGTVKSRMADFRQRHPKLALELREVPDERNGAKRLREFIDRHDPAERVVSAELAEFLESPEKWDGQKVSIFLQEKRDPIEELRVIGELEERSSVGFPVELDLNFGKAVNDGAKMLRLSLVHHLRAGEEERALRDFTAIYGLAAHMDRVEHTNILAMTYGLLMRSAARSDVMELLAEWPAPVDWRPWVEVLASQPTPEESLASVLRGETNFGLEGFILPIALSGPTSNNIRDFTAFEDAYAMRQLDLLARLESGVPLGSLDFAELKAGWSVREKRLEAASREFLDLCMDGVSSWISGLRRNSSFAALHRAALELLAAESDGGAMGGADDPRWERLTRDPETGESFEYDAATRQLRPAERGLLVEDDSVQLPAVP